MLATTAMSTQFTLNPKTRQLQSKAFLNSAPNENNEEYEHDNYEIIQSNNCLGDVSCGVQDYYSRSKVGTKKTIRLGKRGLTTTQSNTQINDCDDSTVQNETKLVVSVGFDITRKGERSLVIDGFKFTKSRDGMCNRVFWRCSRRECKATAVTVDDHVEHVRALHTHKPPIAAEFFSSHAGITEQQTVRHNLGSLSGRRRRSRRSPTPRLHDLGPSAPARQHPDLSQGGAPADRHARAVATILSLIEKNAAAAAVAAKIPQQDYGPVALEPSPSQPSHRRTPCPLVTASTPFSTTCGASLTPPPILSPAGSTKGPITTMGAPSDVRGKRDSQNSTPDPPYEVSTVSPPPQPAMVVITRTQGQSFSHGTVSSAVDRTTTLGVIRRNAISRLVLLNANQLTGILVPPQSLQKDTLDQQAQLTDSPQLISSTGYSLISRAPISHQSDIASHLPVINIPPRDCPSNTSQPQADHLVSPFTSFDSLHRVYKPAHQAMQQEYQPTDGHRNCIAITSTNQHEVLIPSPSCYSAKCEHCEVEPFSQASHLSGDSGTRAISDGVPKCNLLVHWKKERIRASEESLIGSHPSLLTSDDPRKRLCVTSNGVFTFPSVFHHRKRFSSASQIRLNGGDLDADLGDGNTHGYSDLLVNTEPDLCMRVQEDVFTRVLSTVQQLAAKLDGEADPPELIQNCRAIQACLDTIETLKRGNCCPSLLRHSPASQNASNCD